MSLKPIRHATYIGIYGRYTGVYIALASSSTPTRLYVCLPDCLLQGVKKIMVTPIIQNMAYFLLFHAKVMKKSHWLCLDATNESSQASQCEFFHNFCMKQ